MSKHETRNTLLNLSISYLYLRENLKTGITSKENFSSPIILITNLQVSHAIPKKWKKSLEKTAEACAIHLDHYLIKNNLLLSLKKLTSKELYLILIS